MFDWLHGEILSSRNSDKSSSSVDLGFCGVVGSGDIGIAASGRKSISNSSTLVSLVFFGAYSRSSFWRSGSHLDTACHASRACTTLQHSFQRHRQINFSSVYVFTLFAGVLTREFCLALLECLKPSRFRVGELWSRITVTCTDTPNLSGHVFFLVLCLLGVPKLFQQEKRFKTFNA